MEKVLVIPDEQGLELSRRIGTLSEEEEAQLYVWRFHRQPPMELVIFVDSNYQYGFTEFGDRIGLVDYRNCPYPDCLYFDGDNGVAYLGTRLDGSNLRFSASVEEEFRQKA